jgi:endonuclease/exonuclease/phosphatase family metal-dependent hydrolase
MRVMAYNIQDGGRDRLHLIATVIERERPDAIALLEVTEEAVADLSDRFRMHLAFGAADGMLDANVAWLSRTPFDASANHGLPALAKTLLEVELEGLRLFATHLASRHEEQEHPRASEIAAILALLRDVDGPHLLVGDFNALQRDDEPGTPPPGVEPRGDAVPGAARDVLCPLARAGYVDCYRVRHEDPGYTYPADLPWLRIDYAFASADLAPRVKACEMVTSDLAARASDHLPLVVELSSGAAAAEGQLSPARR